MSEKIEKTLWVTSVQPEKINGESYIPTVVYYENGSPIIGFDAVNKPNALVINKEFKVDLGYVVPGGSIDNRKLFKTASSNKKSAFEISKDYIDTLLASVEINYPKSEATNYKHPAKIIVAEPLSFQDEESHQKWIANYRKNIRNILSRYEEVDFLPEPFAVYQYYRYGQRIPHLQDSSKHIAFIIDFGGGTFDACIIESTEQGDISRTGKHSKPLAADSVPVGGFLINREISAYLLKRIAPDNRKGDAETFYKQYLRVLKGELDVEALRDEAQNYISNIKSLEIRVEQAKLELMNKVFDWGLEGDAYEKVMIDIPQSPFSIGGNVPSELYSHQVRDIFIKEIWSKHLSNVVKNVIKSAKERLDGKEITITLISGGSANIKWLQQLLMSDFYPDLCHAEPVPISHSFQEVVANGLAIECARRYFSEESEFVSVTYNPIKLFLNPDDAGLVTNYRYTSINDKVDMKLAKQGDLIPSAQSLSNFFDEEIQWKVRLAKSPKHHLEYFFSRPKGDESDSYYNVEETRVHTKDSVHFDSQVIVSIVIRRDGTAEPKFIYKSPNKDFGVTENSVSGRPFYIDMTADAQTATKRSFYLGLDFGTSNSSVCLLSQEKIKMTVGKQNQSTWNGISRALPDLPFPAAYSARKFMSTHDAKSGAESAREAFESCLAFMAYYAAAEAAHLGLLEQTLNQFQHRSIGPLWALLENSLKILGNNAVHTKGFSEAITAHNQKFTDARIAFTKHKHNTFSADDFNWQDYLDTAMQVLAFGMKDQSFGYFATSDQNGFSDEEYVSLFVSASDNYPFVDKFRVSSSRALNKNMAYVIDRKNNKAISLSPFYFWLERKNSNLAHACYMIDKPIEKSDCNVKPIDEDKNYMASSLNNGLSKAISSLFSTGKIIGGIHDISFL